MATLAKPSVREAGDHIQPGLDLMTGVLNRQLFLGCLKLFVEARVPLSVLLVDLDRFAQFNYNFSHTVGDDILCRIAAILQASVHGTSSIARYGGNEFAVMLACREPREASLIAERLCTAISNYSWPTQGITVSIGVASFSGDPLTVDSLMNTALLMVEEAKAAGGNCV